MNNELLFNFFLEASVDHKTNFAIKKIKYTIIYTFLVSLL